MGLTDYFLGTALWIDRAFKKFPKGVTHLEAIKTTDGFLAIVLLLVGLFYCVAGVKFRKISIGTIMSVAVYTLLKIYSVQSSIVASPVDTILHSILGDKIVAYLPKSISEIIRDTRDAEFVLGYIMLSIAISMVVMTALLPIGKYLGFVGFFFFIIGNVKVIFEKEVEKFPYTHVGVTFLITVLAYLLFSVAQHLITVITVCFVGSSIVLAGISGIWGYPKDFSEIYRNMNKSTFDLLKQVNFIYLILLTAFCIILQSKLYKE